ncbi:MAG: hypothetical protein KKA79_06485 [Nanoarchaeota archaeon]|nr:hypothetical protein [Nanoarchaeota archaeon]
MEEGRKHEQTFEEEKEDIAEGKAEKNLYNEAGRDELVEDEDEATDLDEGFMKGYDEGAKMAKCPVCNSILDDDLVEREINGEVHRFCCDEHAEKYAKEHSAGAAELSVGDVEAKFESEAEEMEDIEKDKKVLKESR